MNILALIPYVPNLIRVRPYNLLRYLAERGNQITLLTLWTNEQDQADIDHLKTFCHEVQALPLPRWRSLMNSALALPTNKPLQAAYCWQPALYQQLLKVLQPGKGQSPFDVVHVEHLRGVKYAAALRHAFPQVPVVWDSVDCISYLFRQAAEVSESPFRRLITRLELSRTARYEGQLASLFRKVLVTSQHDKQAFLALNPQAEPAVTVLPNGVDLGYFQPDPAVEREPATIVVSGKMSYDANAAMVSHLARNIMPVVWAKRPEARLVIVGKDPTPDVQALAQNPQITVTGFVPDLRPYLRQATLAVAPITYGAGIQNKVLEAMACGTPVVASPKAASALQVTPGQELLLAEEAGEFAAAILSLLNHPTQRTQLGQAGHQYVHHYHNWDVITAQLETIYRSVQANP
ncbi:MAG: glycosyltransferase [Chloroflexi bacterium]|nr:glycosyltransferase [Chloroflexota bacterium]